MYKQDIDILLLQIKNIVLNQPLKEVPQVEDSELLKVQEAIYYLAQCVDERNTFLHHLSIGNLDTRMPSRQNLLAGSLKELHSGLKHLAWQANQVAEGDYHQRVNFLGDFSESFNRMIGQLEEREDKLRKKNDALAQYMELLIAVMDGMKEWLIVTEEDTGRIIYTNQSAKEMIYNVESEKQMCCTCCPLLQNMTSYKPEQGKRQRIISCCSGKRIMEIESFCTEWNGKGVYVHLVFDVTAHNRLTQELESMAFKDELTGIYNRRYYMNFLQELLNNKSEFSLCFIDLDGLKKVNDTLGHHVGDEYIKSISDNLQEAMRKTDTLCRIGGDEFVLILLECNEEAAKKRLYEFNEKIVSLQTSYPMSISYGVIYINEKNSWSAEQILKEADQKMYTFKKNNNRNKR